MILCGFIQWISLWTLLYLSLVWASLFYYNFKVSVKRIYDSGKQYAELKESSLQPSEFIIELLNGHSAYYSKEEIAPHWILYCVISLGLSTYPSSKCISILVHLFVTNIDLCICTLSMYLGIFFLHMSFCHNTETRCMEFNHVHSLLRKIWFKSNVLPYISKLSLK